MRRLLVTFCVIAGVITAPSYADDGNTCHRFFDVMRGRAVSIFKDQQNGFEQKRTALSSLFNEVIDAKWIARFVAGAQWRIASDQDRTDFVATYSAYLADRYVGGLDEDDINGMQDIQLVDFQPLDATSYDARTKVIQKDEDPVEINFRLQEDPPGTCHVRDFSIEGVSLLSSQRDQVQTLAQAGGLKEVTKRLLDIIHGKS